VNTREQPVPSLKGLLLLPARQQLMRDAHNLTIRQYDHSQKNNGWPQGAF